MIFIDEIDSLLSMRGYVVIELNKNTLLLPLYLKPNDVIEKTTWREHVELKPNFSSNWMELDRLVKMEIS